MPSGKLMLLVDNKGGDNALNNIDSNGYAQPNERTSWRHPLRLDGKGMG